MLHGETLHSALPWDIPWHKPDHVIFFGVLYLVLFFVGNGVAWVLAQSIKETFCKDNKSAH